MPRKDLEEEKEYEANNKKEVNVQIVTENELLNLKLDRILESQLEIINLLGSGSQEVQKDSEVETN